MNWSKPKKVPKNALRPRSVWSFVAQFLCRVIIVFFFFHFVSLHRHTHGFKLTELHNKINCVSKQSRADRKKNLKEHTTLLHKYHRFNKGKVQKEKHTHKLRNRFEWFLVVACYSFYSAQVGVLLTVHSDTRQNFCTYSRAVLSYIYPGFFFFSFFFHWTINYCFCRRLSWFPISKVNQWNSANRNNKS